MSLLQALQARSSTGQFQAKLASDRISLLFDGAANVGKFEPLSPSQTCPHQVNSCRRHLLFVSFNLLKFIEFDPI